jgi:hypothetical protein
VREGEFWVQAYYIIGSLEKAATYIVVDAFQDIATFLEEIIGWQWRLSFASIYL